MLSEFMNSSTSQPAERRIETMKKNPIFSVTRYVMRQLSTTLSGLLCPMSADIMGIRDLDIALAGMRARSMNLNAYVYATMPPLPPHENTIAF